MDIQKPHFDIILPTYGQDDLTRDCIKSIQDKTRPEYEYNLFKINNKPAPTGYDMPYNVGFSNAVNIGLSMSRAPYIVIINSDTKVKTNGWLESLASMFTPHTGAVGPATNNPRQWQGQQYPVGDVKPHLIDHSFGFDVKLTFFCIMISRAAFLDVGYLDPNLPHGLGADDDWLWRAHLKGWGIKFQPEVVVDHVGAASWDMEVRNRQQKEAVEYLKRKKYD